MKPILFSILFMMISCITFSQEKVYINQDIKNADNSYILKESTVINTPNLLIEKGAKTSVQRKPLHEVFTSSTCGYCPAANAAIDAVALNPNNIDDCTVIKYQVSWPSPGDPYNTPEVGQRRSYYGVTGVPEFYVDANEDSGAAYSQTKLNNYAAVPAYFEIEATHTIVGYDIEVDITITPYMDWQGKCRVAVVERQTTGNVGSNGETEFHNVMMKMLPNPTGTVVNLISGTPYSFQLSGNLASTFIEEMYDLEVVVFLQDDSNKDVMQSNYSEFVPSATDVILTDLNVTNTYSDCALGNAEAVSIEIYNFGADPVSDIEVSYTIDGGEIVEETLAGPIAPMESVDYTFSQTADLSEVGVHNIVASISYSNDEILTNNELDINAVSGDAVLNIYIDFDNYPGETSWELYDDKLDVIVATGSGYTGGATNENYCVISTHCYEFTIYDSYGDGICCSYGSGSYSVTYFGDEVASGGNFTSSESTSIDAVLDLTFDEEMWFCTGETITWETNGSGTFSHETSEIDNLTPSITTVIYTLNEGSDCEISTSFDIIVVDNNIDIANDDIVICAGETVEYPIGYGSFAPETIDNLTPATTTVIYTINEGMSCENTTSFDITVNPIPEIDIVCEDLSFCLNNTVELPTGSGTFSPATIDNTTPGITTVTYTTAENAEGCVDSCSFDVEIINTVIDITPEDIVVCLGQEIIFPDGENGIFDPASIDNMIVGTTTVNYIVADGTECENTTSFDVTVNAIPEIDIACEDLSFCLNNTVELPTGSGTFSPATIDNTTPGITTVTYTTAENAEGCVDSCSFDVEIINTVIDITPEDIVVCLGQEIIFPDGENGIFDPASIDNMIAGTTTVTYIVADGTECENTTSFDVTVNALPEIDISCEDLVFCSSESLVFPEGTGVFEPNTVVEPITDITYTTLPSTDGCVDSCEFIIEVINNEIDITAENITVCQGEVIEFYGGTNGVYSPASVDNMIVGTTTVQYIVAGESDCENIVEFDVTVLEVPAAEISVNDEYLLSSEAVGSLQWYFNDDAIEGATGNTYQCTEDGDYYLIVIAQNDCSTQSNTINVTGTFSDFEALELIEVYPNPASDRITITNVQNCSLYIYNVSGQLVKTINNSDKKLDIDTKYLAEGLYTIKIIKEGLVLVKQIVIEK
jgi:hypothetical protein